MNYEQLQEYLEPVPTPYELYVREETKAKILARFSELPGRQGRVLELRFGIGCAPLTLEQVGKVIGVTRERVRQIEHAGLRALRHLGRPKRLDPIKNDPKKATEAIAKAVRAAKARREQPRKRRKPRQPAPEELAAFQAARELRHAEHLEGRYTVLHNDILDTLAKVATKTGRSQESIRTEIGILDDVTEYTYATGRDIQYALYGMLQA